MSFWRTSIKFGMGGEVENVVILEFGFNTLAAEVVS